jgi:flagellar hook-associated protein 2
MAPIAQFSGLASGIDSGSLINALVEAKLKTNEIRKQKISDLEGQNGSLDELNAKILTLNDLIDKYRTANGGGVNKRSSSSDSSVASAAVSAAASNSTIGVTVTTLASAGTASFSDSYVDGAAQFATAIGTQPIVTTIGSGANQVTISVDVTSSTTVQQFVDAFNADSDASGRATASIVKVADNDYRVAITSLKSGLDDGLIAFTIPAGSNFTDTADLQTRTINQATNAVFNISGIATGITRSTNSISDVLSGVTLQLSKTGTASVSVTDDSETSADTFKEIVDAFNDVVNYVKENNSVRQDSNSKDKTNIFGSLAKTTVDDDFISRFRETMLSSLASTTGTVQSFADIGISTNRDGTLAMDVEKFKSTVASDSNGATSLLRNFADAAAGVSGFMYQFTTFQGFIDTAQGANISVIEQLNAAIAQLERSADKLRDRYTMTFSRLESVTAELQNKQAQLTAAFQ